MVLYTYIHFTPYQKIAAPAFFDFFYIALGHIAISIIFRLIVQPLLDMACSYPPPPRWS